MMAALGGLLGVLVGIVLAFLYREELAFYLDKHYGFGLVLEDFLAQRLPAPVCAPEWGATGRILGLPEAFVAPAAFLGDILLSLLCFLLIFFIANLIVKLLFVMLDRLLSGIGLDWLNCTLGMLLVATKNIIIMIIALGLLYPAVDLAACLGLPWAGSIKESLGMSYLAVCFLDVFNYGKGLLGM